MTRTSSNSPHFRYARTAALAVGVAIFATSCGPQASGEFTFGTPLEFQECFEALDPMKPPFFASRNRIDSVGIFAQSRPDVQADADIVHIEVYRSPADVSSIEGQTIAISGPKDADPQIRAALAVNASCPEIGNSFELRGDVTFDEISTESGESVRGQLTNGTVVVVSDDAPTRTVVEDVSGSWDFTVELGAPYRNYPTFDDEYRRSP